ncbi:MAG: glycoside hydrolase family 3 C-terminal domain-containing protein [Bacilli bacterium]|nr:glycoside hydrolase family 3 C-terminal domain-containing protein [Bacilli bacterium]
MSIKANFKANKIIVSILSAGALLCLGAGVALDVVGTTFTGTMNVLFTKNSIDKEALQSAIDKGRALNQKVEEEGAVLLKNEGNVLPLKGVTNVNVFGIRSTHLVVNGAGSAASNLSDMPTLKESLESAGFKVNKDLWDLSANTKLSNAPKVSAQGGAPDIGEIPLSSYTGKASIDSAKSFSDVAIVTFGRSGGEGMDVTRSGLENNTKHYLELSKDEEALLGELKAKNFKVIVLINSSYPLQCGFLDKYNVDAALWIGGVGVTGINAVGTILNGTVNPSGHLVDTWAYLHRTSSTFINSMQYDLYDENNKGIAGSTDYSEGIYMGYRWYETADAEGFWDTDYSKMFFGATNGYDSVVQFPFGFGLSYTSFTRNLLSAEHNGDETVFTVESTNSGSVAGKDVFQLYVEKPYVEGGIEKSKVELVGFEKTPLLGAGEKSTMTITVKDEELASYDKTADSGKGAYVLDEGAYKFYLGADAHSWKNADASIAKEVTLSAKTYSGDNKRASDKKVASNELADAQQHSGSDIEVLSRKGHFANYNVAFNNKEKIVVNSGSEQYNNIVNIAYADATKDYKGEIIDTKVGQPSDLTIKDMIKDDGKVDFDDPRWDELVSKMSYDDLNKLVGGGGWRTEAIDSIKKPACEDIDGPFGLSNFIKASAGQGTKCTSYCTEVVMASTWNKELLREIGEAIGDDANATGTSGWYAPGANLHRSQFGGRNPEYYSEDPYISGVMAREEISGASSKGLYTYMKHFAFNDIEASRTAKQVCAFDEQTARELYLKPFEMAVKYEKFDSEGKQIGYPTTGIMVSYMWTGENTWCGTNWNLLNNILREEWGFKGTCITDNALRDWMHMDYALKGSTDLILTEGQQSINKSNWKNDESAISALKTASKRILYTYVDGLSRRSVQEVKSTNYWPLVNIAGNVLLYGGAAACLAVIALKLFKKEN